MRGIAPIPFTKACIPHGGHANIAFPTPHLRAYRVGTASILLHLVQFGELDTRCRFRGTIRCQSALARVQVKRFGIADT
jgi:hypothetical protein